MDNSKDYILMCEKIKEIQQLRGEGLWENGDFYTDDILKEHNREASVFEEASDEPYEMYHPTWLPRQGQLQKMIKDKWKSEYCLYYLAMFIKFWKHYDEKYIVSFNSMEQLWLAFVMKEKYNRIWNKKEWEKENTNAKTN